MDDLYRMKMMKKVRGLDAATETTESGLGSDNSYGFREREMHIGIG